MQCNGSKYNCGLVVPSACVPFTGKVLTFVSDADQLQCDANINDVIFVIDKYLKPLVDGNNLTGLTKNCLDFDPSTITVSALHQLEIDELCTLQGQITALTELVNDLNIGSEEVTIALPSCLQSLAAPCVVGPNKYTLLTLLTLFANKICDHEQRISNLES